LLLILKYALALLQDLMKNALVLLQSLMNMASSAVSGRMWNQFVSRVLDTKNAMFVFLSLPCDCFTITDV